MKAQLSPTAESLSSQLTDEDFNCQQRLRDENHTQQSFRVTSVHLVIISLLLYFSSRLPGNTQREEVEKNHVMLGWKNDSMDKKLVYGKCRW